MKKYLCLLIALAFCAALPALAHGEGQRKLTLMVYVCGSNLESEGGAASADMAEMKAGIADDDVGLLVMTGGSSKWSNGLEPGKTCITEIQSGRSRVIDVQPSMSMGSPDTLEYLVRYTMEHYPARDYALIIWNHGNGPLGGVCLDEVYTPDSLSLQEIGRALGAAELPGKLKWIGFDACLMSTVEVANAVAPYAEYMIASQDTEPATGWDYAFLDGIGADADGVQTAGRIAELYMRTPTSEGESLTLSCVDLDKIGPVVSAMDAFFRPLASDVSRDSFSAISDLRLASVSFGRNVRGVGVDGYDLVDLRDLVDKYGERSDPAPLLAALDEAVVLSRSSLEQTGGLSVYHPYYNKTMFRQNWAAEYRNLAFCPGYNLYIQQFGELLVGEDMVDWGALATEDEGFDAEDANWFSLQLTEEQRQSFSSAQLIALAPNMTWGSDRFAETGGADESTYTYSPVYISNARLDENGRLTARYAGRALYVTDAAGNAVLGPIAYRLSGDGQTYYILAEYADTSGREDFAPNARVMFTCRLEADDRLTVRRTDVYDPLTDTYSNRVPLSPEDYTRLVFDDLRRQAPENEYPLPGFDEWGEGYGESDSAIDLDEAWQLRFFDFQQSGKQIYVAFQITDAQQNTYMSDLMPLENPNLLDIDISPRTDSRDGTEAACYLVRDVSPLDPALSLCLEITNHTDSGQNYYLTHLVFNGTRSVGFLTSSLYVGSGYSDKMYVQLSRDSLTGLSSIDSVDVTLYVDGPVQLHFTPADCDISDLAPPVQPVLAEAEQDGLKVQLTGLEQDRDGLAIVVHYENNGPESCETHGHVAAEGLLLEGKSDWFRLMPGTDGYARFEVSDRTELSDTLKIARKGSADFLAQEKLFERCGIDSIRSIELMRTYAYTVDSVVKLELEEPFALQSDAGADLAFSQTLSLLEGDVSVDVERVLVADNGVGLRLVARNRTARAAYLRIDNRMVNGFGTENRYPTMVPVMAGGTTVTCIGIDASYPNLLDPGAEIRDIALTFTHLNYTTSLATITLNQPVTLGAVKGRYLSAGEMKTEPARWLGNSEIALTPAAFDSERFPIRLYAGISNAESYNAVAPDAGGQCLGFGIHMDVENRSDVTVDASTTHFVLNGCYETTSSWIEYGIAPGRTASETWTIQPEDLKAVGRVKRVQCVMQIRNPEDYSDIIESIPIDVAVEDLDLSPLTPGGPISTAEGQVLTSRPVSAEPIRWDGHDAVVLSPSECEGEQIRVRAAARLKRDEDDGSLRFGVSLEVENRSGRQIDVESSGFVLNGTYQTATEWAGYNIRPGKVSAKAEYLEPADLAAIGAPERIEFDLTVRDADDYQDVLETLHFDLAVQGADVPAGGLDLSGLAWGLEPLAETTLDGVTWQLIEVRVDGEGRVTGWLNAINETDEEREYPLYSMRTAIVQGIRGESFFPGLTLPRRNEYRSGENRQYIPFAFDNCARVSEPVLSIPGTTGYAVEQMDHLLQRHGIKQITELTFVLNGDTLAFRLPEPLAVPPVDLEERPQRLLLEGDGMSVWLESVLVGNDGISLGLEVRNDTDGACRVLVDALYIDHSAAVPNVKTDDTTVPPHTAQSLCATSLTWDALYPGDFIQNLLVSFQVELDAGDYRLFRDASIRLNAPMAMNHTEGVLLTAESYAVEPARTVGTASIGLEDAPSLPLTANLRPRTLVPPLTEDQARRFAGGEACICKLEETWDYDYETESFNEYEALVEYVRLDLEQDDAGTVCAPYSGMILRVGSMAVSDREQARDGAVTVGAAIYSFMNYYEAYATRPARDDSPFPDLDPLGEVLPMQAYETEDNEIIEVQRDHFTEQGLKTVVEFRLENEGSDLRLLERAVWDVDMNTGEAMPQRQDILSDRTWTAFRPRYSADGLEELTPFYINELEELWSFHPSLAPIEREEEAKGWTIRYHIRYTDGTDEVILVEY